MKYLTPIIFALSIIIISCEEQPLFIPDNSNQMQDSMNTVPKRVLLEELTGASCPNCPAGTAALESILTVFGDRVVTNAIHGKFLSQPTPQSAYDFRNEDAEDLENFLAPFLGKPAAVIDRFHFEGQDFMTVDVIGLWQSFVQKRLDEPARIDLRLVPDFNNITRVLTVQATVEALEDLQGNIKLSVVINESHIIDAQSNQNQIIPDYEHNHVMRDMLSTISGDILINGLQEGDEITRTYTYTVPEENNGEWVAENMELIAFVTASEFDNQVLQAAAAHVTE